MTTREQELINALHRASENLRDSILGVSRLSRRECDIGIQRAADELMRFRASQAKAETVKPERCEPPEEFKTERWHWLSFDGDKTLEAAEFNIANGQWARAGFAKGFQAEFMHEIGWRYHSPLRPPEPVEFDESAEVSAALEACKVIDTDIFRTERRAAYMRGYVDRARKGFPRPPVEWREEEVWRLWQSRNGEDSVLVDFHTKLQEFARALLEGRKP